MAVLPYVRKSYNKSASFAKLSDHIQLEIYRVINEDRRIEYISKQVETQNASLAMLSSDGQKIGKGLSKVHDTLGVAKSAVALVEEQKLSIVSLEQKERSRSGSKAA